MYGSVATHAWAERCCDLLGVGESGFCKILVDSHDCVDIAAMSEAIDSDRKRGCRPFCIVGNAGTVATGATDDLTALAELAQDEAPHHLGCHRDRQLHFSDSALHCMLAPHEARGLGPCHMRPFTACDAFSAVSAVPRSSPTDPRRLRAYATLVPETGYAGAQLVSP